MRGKRLPARSPWACVAVAIVLPLFSVGRWFGFVALPPLFFLYLISATAGYLALVEITKGFFYRYIDEG